MHQPSQLVGRRLDGGGVVAWPWGGGDGDGLRGDRWHRRRVHVGGGIWEQRGHRRRRWGHGRGSGRGHACHDGSGIVVGRHLEFHAHEDVVYSRGSLARHGLQLGELFGLEVVELDEVVKFPEEIGQFGTKAADIVLGRSQQCVPWAGWPDARRGRWATYRSP